MSLEADTWLLIPVFIVPGFASYYARNYLTVDPSEDRTIFEETQISILHSILIVLILFWFFAGIAASGLTYLGPDVSELLSKGAVAFSKSHPIRLGLYVSAWVTFSILLGILFGKLNPIDALLGRLSAKGLLHSDVWYKVLELDRKARNKGAYVSISLDNNDIYEGWLSAFSLIRKNQSVRDVALQQVTYRPAGDQDPSKSWDMRKYKQDSQVIISASRITAIRLIHLDVVPLSSESQSAVEKETADAGSQQAPRRNAQRPQR